MGWNEGFPSPNPPVNIASGGPAGTGDNYLQNVSSGGFGSGSAQVMFNDDQWSGNYLAAGVTEIQAQMANFGDSELFMRIALVDGFGTWYGSSSAFVLPADGIWRDVTFGLSFSDLNLIIGSSSITEVLENVEELRILSAAGGSSFRGDRISGTLGIDNITAVPVPATIFLLGSGLAILVRLRSKYRN